MSNREVNTVFGAALSKLPQSWGLEHLADFLDLRAPNAGLLKSQLPIILPTILLTTSLAV